MDEKKLLLQLTKLCELSNFGEAEQLLSDSGSLSSAHPDLLSIGGYICIQQGNWDLARQYLTRSIKIQDDHFATRLNLSLLEMKLSEWKMARDILSSLLQEFPDNPKVLRNWGVVSLHQSMYDDAIRTFQNLVDQRIEPLDENKADLSLALLGLKKYDEALQVIQTASTQNRRAKAILSEIEKQKKRNQ